MKAKEIRLNPAALKCLMRGGSIDFEFKDGIVVSLSIERKPEGFRQPANAER